MMNKNSKIFVILMAAGIVIIGIFLILVVWMNLTPGYFQSGVCGYVGYYKDDEIGVMKNWETRCRMPSSFERFEGRVLIQLSKLDFNRNLYRKSIPTSPGQNQSPIEGKFCGGIAGNLPQNQCPSGYKCQLDGKYPDAGGKCVKSVLFGF